MRTSDNRIFVFPRAGVTAFFLASIPALAAAPAASGACDFRGSERLANQGRFEEALGAVRGCEEGAPTGKARGIAFHGLYRADSALIHLKRAFDLGLRDDAVRIPLAEVFLWKKDFRNAKGVMDGVKNKEAPAYLMIQARRHEILGEFPAAVALYDRVVSMDKLPYGAMERRAIVLSWMKRFDESIVQFDAIIQSRAASQPLKIRCRIRKAEVLSWKGRNDHALAEIDRVLVLDPKNADARLVKGRILEWKGEFKPAIAVYREILKTEPENSQALLRLERLAWADTTGRK